MDDYQDLHNRANLEIERLSRSEDGYACMVFVMNPETNHWSFGMTQEFMDLRRFSIIAAGAGKVLENMINGR